MPPEQKRELWFVEEAVNNGWAPVTYWGEQPTKKRLSGQHRRFRQDPKRVPECHHHLTLSQLAEVYGIDGRFKPASEPRATKKGAGAAVT